VRVVLDHGWKQSSRWSSIVAMASMIRCAAHTLNE
jgi:hypothetical protein